MNVHEDEALLPEIYQSKIEKNVKKNLEETWKSIQRRNDRQIHELVALHFNCILFLLVLLLLLKF